MRQTVRETQVNAAYRWFLALEKIMEGRDAIGKRPLKEKADDIANTLSGGGASSKEKNNKNKLI